MKTMFGIIFLNINVQICAVVFTGIKVWNNFSLIWLLQNMLTIVGSNPLKILRFTVVHAEFFSWRSVRSGRKNSLHLDTEIKLAI